MVGSNTSLSPCPCPWEKSSLGALKVLGVLGEASGGGSVPVEDEVNAMAVVILWKKLMMRYC